MVVHLQLGEPIWRKINQRVLVVNNIVSGISLYDFLEEVSQRYPEIAQEMQFELGEEDIYYSIFVNGQQILWTKSRQTFLSNGDEVMLLLPLSGG